LRRRRKASKTLRLPRSETGALLGRDQFNALERWLAILPPFTGHFPLV
jgi:hypothetical protein